MSARTSRNVPRRVRAVAAALLSVAATASATEYDLYVLSGQSNMDGYGAVEQLSDEQRGPVDGAVIFHGNTVPDGQAVGGGLGRWAPLEAGHGRGFWSDGRENHHSDAFGLELTFAEALRARHPDRKVAIVKYSRGGTSIDRGAAGDFGCWDPDFDGGEGPGKGVNQYDHFLATLRNAAAVRDVDGDGEDDVLVPRAILWMQGESDAAYDEAIARAYEANLRRLMDLMRAAVRVDDLPVIIGRISDSRVRAGAPEGDRTWKHGELVRALQARWVEADGHAALVTSTDGYDYSDPWHYDTAGYLDLGRRFEEALHGLAER